MLIPILLVLASCASSQPAVSSPDQDGVVDRRPAPQDNPLDRAKPWVEDALQIDSVEKRQAAIESIRAAISGTDEQVAHAGLIALTRIGEVEFDKASFREPVLRWTDAKDERVRMMSFYALYAAGKQAGDLDRVLVVERGLPAAMRREMVHVIAMFADMKLTGAAGDEVAKILATDDRQELRQALAGLWGTKVSPSIEARLLELANGKDAGIAHDAIYYGLSTLQEKSEPVVDRLIKALSEGTENAWRALWGLGQGISPALEPKVAEAAMNLYAARSDRQTRTNALSLIERFGSEPQAVALEALAQKPGISDDERKVVLESARKIRGRTITPR